MMIEQQEYKSIQQLIRSSTRSSLLKIITSHYDKLIRDPVISVLHQEYLEPSEKQQQIVEIFAASVQNALELEVDRLTDELAQAQMANATLSRKLNQYQQNKGLHDSLVISHKHITDLQSQKQLLEQKIDGLARDRERQEKAIKDILRGYNNENVEDVEFTIRRLLNELKFCQKSLASREELFSRMNREVNTLRERVAVLEEQEVKTIRQPQNSGLLKVLQEENLRLKVDVRELKNTIEQLRAELEEGSVARNQEVEKSRQQKNQMQNSIRKLQKEKQYQAKQLLLSLNQEGKTRQIQQDLRMRIEELEVALRQERSIKDQQIRELNDKVEQLTNKLSQQRNLKKSSRVNNEQEAIYMQMDPRNPARAGWSSRSHLDKSHISCEQSVFSKKESSKVFSDYGKKVQELCRQKIGCLEKELMEKTKCVWALESNNQSLREKVKSMEQDLEECRQQTHEHLEKAKSAAAEKEVLQKTLEFCKKVYDEERAQLRKMVSHHQQSIVRPNQNSRKNLKIRVSKALAGCLSEIGRIRKDMSRIKVELDFEMKSLTQKIAESQWEICEESRMMHRKNNINYTSTSTLQSSVHSPKQPLLLGLGSYYSEQPRQREDSSDLGLRELKSNYRDLKQYLRYVQQLFTDRDN